MVPDGAVERRLPGKINDPGDKADGLDVLDFLRETGPRLDAIICNLFLHHLDGDLLSDVLALAAERAPLFVACEPRRARIALQASKHALGTRRERRDAPRRGGERARRLYRQ